MFLALPAPLSVIMPLLRAYATWLQTVPLRRRACCSTIVHQSSSYRKRSRGPFDSCSVCLGWFWSHCLLHNRELFFTLSRLFACAGTVLCSWCASTACSRPRTAVRLAESAANMVSWMLDWHERISMLAMSLTWTQCCSAGTRCSDGCARGWTVMIEGRWDAKHQCKQVLVPGGGTSYHWLASQASWGRIPAHA